MKKGKKKELLEQIMLSVPKEIKKMNNPMALYASIMKSINDYISGKSWKEGVNDELLKSLTPKDVLYSILAETEYQKENNNPGIVLNLVEVLIAFVTLGVALLAGLTWGAIVLAICFLGLIIYWVVIPGKKLLNRSKYAHYINLATKELLEEYEKEKSIEKLDEIKKTKEELSTVSTKKKMLS